MVLFRKPFLHISWSRVAALIFFLSIAGVLFFARTLPALVAVNTWPFDTAGDYTYNTSLVDVTGGVATLVAITGGTTTTNHNDNGSTEFGGGTSTSIQWVSASSSLRISSGVSGTFTSVVIDAGVTTTWQTLAWTPFAPYGKELVTSTAETQYSFGNFTNTGAIAAYWRLNESSWNGTTNEVQNAVSTTLHGSRRGGATTSGTAQFGRSGSFPLANTSYVHVTTTNFLADSQSGTIMAWIFPTSTGGGTFRHFFASTDESTSDGNGNRVVLGMLDSANQLLFYHADGSGFDSNIGNTVMAANEWHHVAITNSGAANGYRMYVDGVLQTLTTFGGGNSGDWFADANGSGATNRDNITIGGIRHITPDLLFDGLVDELVIFSQELSTSTIRDLYRRGAQRLSFQVRSCDDSACSGETFTGPDGTAASYYTESTTTTVGLPSKSLITLPANRYFQYQTLFNTTSTELSPGLLSVTTTGFATTTYSTTSPTIINNTGFSFRNISAFTHSLGAGNAGTVEYQVAVGNTSTFYYWNGSNWVTASAGYPTHTNTVSEVNSNIIQLDTDVGVGTFYFRAFLASNGAQQVQLSEVAIMTTSTISFAASSGSASEGSGTSTIVVQLDEVSSSTMTVNYAVTGGTATATSDYVLASGTSTIAAGSTTTSISIQLVDDSVIDGSETVILTLTNAIGGLLGSTTTFTLTITDNDTAGVTLNPSSVSVTEGGSDTSYTIVLNTQPSSTVSITLATSTGDISLSTTSITFTTSTWNSAQTITVTPVNDSDVEGTHSDTITHTASSTDSNYHAISISNMSVSVTDDDASSSSGGGGGGGGGGSFIPTTPAPQGFGGTGNGEIRAGEGAATNLPVSEGSFIDATNRAVTISFAVEGATRMALSNQPDFALATQEPYRPSVIWDVCGNSTVCPEGIYTLYARFYNSYGVSGNVISRQIRYRPTSSSVTLSPSLVRLLKSADDPKVFEVINGEKRWLVNEQAFLSRGYSWGAIEVVPSSVLRALPDAGQISTPALLPPTNRSISPAFRFSSYLSFGSQGAAVRSLQVLLVDLGYFPRTVQPNGVFGPTTRGAVQAFQRANGLTPIGVVGPQTRALLNGILSARGE